MLKSLWNNNKDFRVFVWQVFNALVAFGTSYVTGLDNSYVPVIMLILNQLTKRVNTTYFGDIGVNKSL